ncbi:P-loop containing nucleoside triphosphate hydrolase [Phytophthora cactorum]|nr:P-loop containing nucleoside triphosphate hydrolase [Phytophthora cactorum]
MEELRHVHVEVCLKQESVADYEQVGAAVAEYLGATTSSSIFSKGSVMLPVASPLASHVERIDVTEFDGEESSETGVPRSEAHLFVHVFKLSDEPPAEETADDEDVTTCQQTILPATSFDGLWESLIFDAAVKRNVLDYAMTAMLFSDSNVNPHIISWNRVVLLHGPPGTGKTSLCKALAHKLSIRLSSRYPNAVLLEINAHSLFSKWFSESGKLVMKLFRQIQELVEDEESLVCVLIDEVESLTAARKSAVSGSEPSDAIRVVNALLTQLDSLKRYSNVLILTTSNITEAIDVAFVDRADINSMLSSMTIGCSSELTYSLLCQHAASVHLPRANEKKSVEKAMVDQMTSPLGAENGNEDLELSMALLQAAELAQGFSGRALRKLPFQAHAFFVQTRTATASEFIHHLVQTIQRENEHKQQLHRVRSYVESEE